MQASPILSLSPSINAYYSRRLVDIAMRVVEEFREESESNDDFFDPYTEELISSPHKTSNPKPQEQQPPQIEQDNGDFEFSFVYREPDTCLVTADEIFYNGRIRPIFFPKFNTDLVLGGVAQKDRVSKPQTKHRLPLRMLMAKEHYPPS